MVDAEADGDRIASRPMFDESERRHPIQEAEKIKVENIRRMTKRLEALPHVCKAETLIYEHGTHFVFPESMLKTMIPVGSGLLVRLMFKAGREYPKACRQTRIDIDEKLSRSILDW